MSDENFFEELAETHRKLWAQSDGTIAGYAALCEKIALQARAEFAQYGDAWRGVGREPAKPAGDATKKRTPPRRRMAEFADATAVHEDSPKYAEGETQDSARDACAEGE